MFDSKPPNVSILLGIELDGPNIALRIELDPFGRESFDQPPVLALCLVPERPQEEIYGWLTTCVGAPFDTDIWPTDPGTFTLDVHVNFAADGVPLGGTWVAVVREPRSEADLRLLVRYLRRAASQFYEELLSVEAADGRFRQRLRTHLEHAIDNAQRKAAYFAEANPERARCEGRKERALTAVLDLIDTAGRDGAT